MKANTSMPTCIARMIASITPARVRQKAYCAVVTVMLDCIWALPRIHLIGTGSWNDSRGWNAKRSSRVRSCTAPVGARPRSVGTGVTVAWCGQEPGRAARRRRRQGSASACHTNSERRGTPGDESMCVHGSANRNRVSTVSDDPKELGKHRRLRGHSDAHRGRVKSLIESALVGFGARQHASAESISKRARSTTPTSLRLESTSCGRSGTV